MDVVKKIAQGDKLLKVEIFRNGSDANAFKADQAAFDSRLRAPSSPRSRKRSTTSAPRISPRSSRNGRTSSMDADGIFQKTIKNGSGPAPTPGQTVKVAYKGMSITGQVFDQSDFHGGPVDFQIGTGKIIPGWDKVVMEMKTGEKRSSSSAGARVRLPRHSRRAYPPPTASSPSRWSSCR